MEFEKNSITITQRIIEMSFNILLLLKSHAFIQMEYPALIRKVTEMLEDIPKIKIFECLITKSSSSIGIQDRLPMVTGV